MGLILQEDRRQLSRNLKPFSEEDTRVPSLYHGGENLKGDTGVLSLYHRGQNLNDTRVLSLHYCPRQLNNKPSEVSTRVK